MKTYESKHKDMNAIVMESDCLKLTILPESGGKLQSIYDKEKDREYLHQSNTDTYIRSAYDSEYAAGDVSGFDEIFPSIETCYYPAYPWQGIKIPDHGEVWALPWDCRLEDDHVTMSVYGVRFPYRLEKDVRFLHDRAIRISYRATNFSDFEFPFIWAPHLLLQCEEGTEIELPPSVSQVISTCSVDNRLGTFGRIHSWPETRIDGEIYRINQVYPKYEGKCEKYYVLDELSDG
jgi:hypothetical protein